MAQNLNAGREIRIRIDHNGVGGTGANWLEVGYQRGGELGKKTDTVDATSKQDEGWGTVIPIRNQWNVSVDGALKIGDPALVYLKQAWKTKTVIFVQIYRQHIGGDNEEGEAVIEDLSESFAEGELYTYKCELKGNGPLNVSP